MRIPKITLLPLILMTFLVTKALTAEEANPVEDESDLKHLPQPSPERDETVRNQAIAAQLALTDKETEATWLGTGKDQFLALFLPDTSGKLFANALILHDNLQNPDWPGVVRELRHELTKGGWSTLSIAVPDYIPSPNIPPLESVQADTDSQAVEEELDTEATEPPGMNDADADTSAASNQMSGEETDSLPDQLSQRLQLATQHISAKNGFPVVIIAVGSSAAFLFKQAQDGALGDVNGLVIIDPLPIPELDGMNLEVSEMNFRLPLLDIVPEFNPRSAPEPRAAAARRQRQGLYQQRIIRGSNRDFRGAETRLIKTIRGWAETLFQRR